MKSKFTLKNFIKNQFPEIVREDYPLFVSFMEAYYEWLGNNDNRIRVSSQLENLQDIDETLDIFIEDFHKTYISSFPVNLAINPATGKKVDARKLIKNIKNFYSSKGIKKSFGFIFRLLYNTEVEIYYPKEKLLNLSDGRWISDKILLLNPQNPQLKINLLNREICQRQDYRNSNSQITSRAKISSLSSTIKNQRYIWEIYLSEVQGTFSADKPVIDLENGTNYGIPYSILRDIKINDGGYGYKKGQEVNFTQLSQIFSGKLPKAVIKTTSPVSSSSPENSETILEFVIKDQGLLVDENNCGLSSSPIDQDGLTGGTGFSGTLLFGALFEKNEYYANTKGQLSSNMLLQDNKKWQSYSYVLRSDVTLSKYRNLVKKMVHPAGMEFFAETLIKKCVVGSPDVFLNIPTKLTKRIGNFLPYTFLTYDNLGTWFGGFCYATGEHDTLIINADLTGNPVSSNVSFSEASQGDCITADIPVDFDPQYWVTFNHPNTRISSAVGYITENQLSDFYGPTSPSGLGQSSDGWQEWELSSRYGGTTEEQENWLNDILNSPIDREYATLFVDRGTEFRKIPIYSFINDVQCSYDCRYTNNCVEEDVDSNDLSPPLYPEDYDPKTKKTKPGANPTLIVYYENINTLSEAPQISEEQE